MSMESFFEKTEANIRQTGLSVVGVFGEANEPTFSYTIGLTDRGWPEMIMVGIPAPVATTLFNEIYAKGEAPKVGDVIEGVANFPLHVGRVSEASKDQYLCQAIYRQERIGGPSIDAVQIIYPDTEGKFPNEPGYNLDQRIQLMLGDLVH